jgi:hypothetical protein
MAKPSSSRNHRRLQTKISSFIFRNLLINFYNKYMPRKKKIEQLKETNAKVETFQPTTLDQIWGDTGKGKYGTMNEVEYQAKLKGMNRSDLQSHARSLGIMPNDNYELLIRKLMQEFRLHVSAFRIPTPAQSKPAKLSPQVSKILAEGR